MPELQAALDAMPASDGLTFLMNDYGRPFASSAAFGNKFADWCIEAGLQPVLCDDGRVRNYRAHGLSAATHRICRMHGTGDHGCERSQHLVASVGVHRRGRAAAHGRRGARQDLD
jgi:hypothetical protein